MPEDSGGRLRDSAVVRSLVQNLPEAIYVMTDGGRIIDGNTAFLTLIGARSMDEACAVNAEQLWCDADARLQALQEIARSGQLKDFEYTIRGLDGRTRTVLDTCYVERDVKSGERLLYGILVDITERKRAEDELRRAAIRDPLTGCYNRRYLEEMATRLGKDDSWGAVVVDIDHFKDYNDRFGHKAGDEVLLRLTRFLGQLVRPGDAVIRLGGDEFLVILFGKDADFIVDIASRFKDTAPKRAPVPFSLGWAVRDRGETLYETIARADEELIYIRVEERRGRRPRSSSGGFRVSPP